MIKKISISEDKKRLLGNFLSLAGLQGFTYILPLITLPYLVRVLGVEKYGLVMFSQSFVAFFIILVDYGFNLSATREIAVSRNDNKKVSEIYGSVMLIKLALLFVSFFVFAVLVISVDKFSGYKQLYFFAFLAVIGQAFFPVWYFQGMERMKYITIINILSRSIFTVAIFVFVGDEDDYLLVPLLNGVGFCIGSLFAIWVINKRFSQKIVFPAFCEIKRCFKESSGFFLSRVSVSIYTAANVFVLGFFTSNTMVGYYSVAEKLYQALLGLYAPIVQTLYPYLSSSKNMGMYKKIFIAVVFFNILLISFLCYYHGVVIELLFKSPGQEINNVFLIFLTSALLHVPAILLGYPLLGAFGFSRYANITVMQSSAVHLLGLVLLMAFGYISIYSVSVMVVITEATVFFTRLYYSKKVKLLLNWSA